MITFSSRVEIRLVKLEKKKKKHAMKVSLIEGRFHISKVVKTEKKKKKKF
jgi:hypothetical protein